VIVIDASALVEALIPDPRGDRVRRRIVDSGATLHAPELIDLEVTHALRRHERMRALSSRRATEAVATLRRIRLNRYPHALFLSRIWELRNNLTTYDAAYVALAEVLAAPLLTMDRRLAHASGVRAVVEVA
jgi:predicted nucleic acid-binding protein